MSDYQGLADQSTALTDYNAVDFHVQMQLSRLRTATIVQIVKAPYDKQGNAITPGAAVDIGYVDVQPLVNQVTGQGKAQPHAPVYHLSYHRYQGGNGAFISDPVVGDQGFMVCADRDTSSVRATGKQANPGSGRRFDFADGTCFGCPQGASPAQWFAFLAKGIDCKDAWGNTLQGTENGWVLNGATITQAGDIVTKHGTSLDKHVNTKVTAGTDDSGPPP